MSVPTISDAPKFKCRREQVIEHHAKNQEVKCVVQANPALQTVMFEFLWEGTMETLQPGQRTDDNEIHVTQTVRGTMIRAAEIRQNIVFKGFCLLKKMSMWFYSSKFWTSTRETCVKGTFHGLIAAKAARFLSIGT